MECQQVNGTKSFQSAYNSFNSLVELQVEAALVVNLLKFCQAKTTLTIVFYREANPANIHGLTVHTRNIRSKAGEAVAESFETVSKILAKYNEDNWIYHTVTTGQKECQESTSRS